MLFQYIFIAFSGFFWTIAAIIISRKIVRERGFLVAKNVPLIGGISLGLAFFITSFLVFGFYPSIPAKVAGILSACGLMLFFGIMDDIREMPALFKAILQIISAGLVILAGVRSHIGFLPESANYAWTLIWILVITNAFNLLDVADGLAGGTAFLAGASFFIVSVFTGDTAVSYLLICFLGGLAAFLLYNFPPAKIYMGNSGSHFLGFFLAVVSILLQHPPAAKGLEFFSPLLILGFPVSYVLFAVWIHLQKGRSLFIKINGHPAGRSYASGRAQRMDLFIMLGFCFIFCCAGVLISRFSNPAVYSKYKTDIQCPIKG